MKLSAGLSIDSIAVLIVCGVIVLIGVTIALYFLFFRNKKLERQIRDLDRRFEYLHSLLIGQDAQYVKRLEYISQLNLLYGEIHEKFLNRYNTLVENRDAYAQNKMGEIKNKLAEKKYKLVRSEYVDVKNFINDFDEDVNMLNTDLLQIIKPEEECHHALFEVTENYRLVRQEYITHQTELVIVSDSYTAIFKYIESQCKKFEDFVDNANYQEAMSLLPELDKIIKELKIANDALPAACLRVGKEVPQKISDLENEFMHMKDKNYPINHILTKATINDLRRQLEKQVKLVKNFKYKDINPPLDDICEKIKGYSALFAKEREDCETFNKEVEDVYSQVAAIEKEFIILCNSLPKIKEVYVIAAEQLKKRDNLQRLINKICVSKRSLDTFIHSVTRQPYSMLLVKLRELNEEANTIKREMADFKYYLSSLKEETEAAHEMISEYFYRLKTCEKIIRDVALTSFTNKYESAIDEIYGQLEIINKTSTVLPINVEALHNVVGYLKTTGVSTLNQIEQDYSMMKSAESVIVYANKDRNMMSNVNDLIEQSEKMFFDGEFEKAYNDTNIIIARIKEFERNKNKKKRR